MRLLAFATGLSICLTLIAGEEKPTGPLPREKDVRSLKVFYLDDKTNDRASFEISKKDWAKILDALAPAKRDDHPARWELLGAMVLVTTEGKSIVVNLYSVGEGVGAFSIENADRKGRTYYRGGKSADLLKALRAASRNPFKVEPTHKKAF
ncbi:MAG: hypothetical protein NVSMB14_09640 [Isosphaeraceae bacterium]